MPTYEYVCRACDRHTEVVQSFRDATLTTCGTCGGQLRKVFGAAGIIFKGSGYYVNDTRGKKPSSGEGEGSPAKPAGDTPATKEPASKPADSGSGGDAGAKSGSGATSGSGAKSGSGSEATKGAA